MEELDRPVFGVRSKDGKEIQVGSDAEPLDLACQEELAVVAVPAEELHAVGHGAFKRNRFEPVAESHILAVIHSHVFVIIINRILVCRIGSLDHRVSGDGGSGIGIPCAGIAVLLRNCRNFRQGLAVADGVLRDLIAVSHEGHGVLRGSVDGEGGVAGDVDSIACVVLSAVEHPGRCRIIGVSGKLDCGVGGLFDQCDVIQAAALADELDRPVLGVVLEERGHDQRVGVLHEVAQTGHIQVAILAAPGEEALTVGNIPCIVNGSEVLVEVNRLRCYGRRRILGQPVLDVAGHCLIFCRHGHVARDGHAVQVGVPLAGVPVGFGNRRNLRQRLTAADGVLRDLIAVSLEGDGVLRGSVDGEGLRYGEVALGKGNGVFALVLDLSGVINGTRPAGSVNCKSCAAKAEAGGAERCCGIEHLARFLKIRSDCDLRGFHNEAAAAGECACPCKGAVVKDGQGAAVGHRAVHGQGLALGNGQAGACGDRQIVDGTVGRQGDVAVDRAVHHALGQGRDRADVRSGDPGVAVDGERAGIGGILAAADVCAAVVADGGNRAALNGDVAAVAGRGVPFAAAADACRAIAADGGDGAALDDDGAAALVHAAADAGAAARSPSTIMVFGTRLNRAAARDGQRVSRFDHDACLISAADEQVLALENQRDVCGAVYEAHRAQIVHIGIVNGQVACLDRYRCCRVDHKVTPVDRAGDGDLLRGIKVRRGPAAVFDLDRAWRGAVQDLDGALSDVKDIAVGVACRERAEGQHRQEHAQRQEDRSQPFHGVLHVCFLLLYGNLCRSQWLHRNGLPALRQNGRRNTAESVTQ